MADEIPEGWRECKLGDELVLQYGKGLREIDRKQGNIPVYGSNGPIGYHNEYLVKGPGIIIGRKGSVGEVKYSALDFYPIDTTYYVETNDKNDIKFLYYFLLTLQLNEMNSHSAVPGLNRNDVYSLDVSFPPLPEQKAIASVLSSLDDKIDLLHRENKTLEAMAETLFRQWFVEEASDDWEEVPLSDVCVILNGFAFKSKDYRKEGIRIIRTLNFMNGFIDLNDLVYIDYDCEEDYKKYRLRDNDFLMVMVGANLGNFAIVTSDILPALQNQNMWNFRATNKVSQYYLNYALIKIIKDNIGSASGSAREFFQKKQFYSFNIKIPPSTILEKFDYLMNNFFQKMKNNRLQIHTLKKLRDILLPKLISGEVRVKI